MTTSLGLWSIAPPLVSIFLALWTKRVVESLLLGIAIAAWALDYSANGLAHSLLFFIPNTFTTLAGHAAGNGLEGVGLVKNAGRGQLMIFIILLGSFMTVLDQSGGALDFARRATRFIKNQTHAILTAWLIGLGIVTSAYFTILVTGSVMRPIFDRLKMSREKLAFCCHAMSVPVKALLPISGWIAYMVTLIEENIPDIPPGQGLAAFVKTMPYNYYSWIMPLFVLLIAWKIIPDYGPMRTAELRVAKDGLLHKPGSKPMMSEEYEQKLGAAKKEGKMVDMFVPLVISVLCLVVLGMWNHFNTQFEMGLPKLPLDTAMILNLGFALGILVAFIQYTRKGLMKPTEFLDHVVNGGKSMLLGGFIILMAVTLGDVMKAHPTEGVGTAAYLVQITKPIIIPNLLPAVVFLLAAIISFSTGTSWGTWALMMPIAMPIALSSGVNPFLAAAAVLSGGAFGDQSGPISDTSVLSAIGANTDLIEHIRTQLPYAMTCAAAAFLFFLLAGIFNW